MIIRDVYTTGGVPGREIRLNGAVIRSAVIAANLLKDLRERYTNTFGGRMSEYEKVVDQALSTAVAEMLDEVREAGGDGIVGLMISHPSVVDGGAEIVVSGTSFSFADGDGPAGAP